MKGKHILVLGGTGRMGRHISSKLLSRGEAVSIMSRHASNHQYEELKKASFVNGSILHQEDVKKAAEGAQAIVIVVEPSLNPFPNSNSAKHIFIDGHKNVIEAARASKVPIILISQIYITRPEKERFLQNVVEVRGEGEELIQNSGLPYTIIRPAWLTNAPGGKNSIRFEQGDTGDGEITREDVAEVCIQTIFDDAARYKTFEIYNEQGTTPNNWKDIFQQLSVDCCHSPVDQTAQPKT